MAQKLAANQIVDDMVARRLISHPKETWTRDVPLIVQRRYFPKTTGIARESDAGRGAVAFDIYGLIPRAGGVITEEIVISIKSQVKDRATASSACLTAGTMDHIRNIAEALMDPSRDYPVICVAQDTRDGKWRQTFFDAGTVMRTVAAMDKYQGDSGIPGISWATGTRGVPVIIRETGREGTENMYYQLNFNLGVLVTPKGAPVSRVPGVYGLGLAEPWREVPYPEIQW